MSQIPSGKAQIGSEEGPENEQPNFELYIPSFWLDDDLVTVAEFRLFVRLTGYITDAERYENGLIYNSTNQTWESLPDAYWEYPLGSEKAKSNDPVTMISWNDAQAYAIFLKKRLPTEFEWEYAMKQNSNISNISPDYWEWTSSWFRDYGSGGHYNNQLNRKKVLRGGLLFPDLKLNKNNFSPSRRVALAPNQSLYNLGFRCAQDLE